MTARVKRENLWHLRIRIGADLRDRLYERVQREGGSVNSLIEHLIRTHPEMQTPEHS